MPWGGDAALPADCGGRCAGVGLVPQLGWSSWNHFGPNINENLTLGIAGAMASSGMAAVGYEYALPPCPAIACA